MFLWPAEVNAAVWVENDTGGVRIRRSKEQNMRNFIGLGNVM
jgi:hypothetical protein